MSKRFLLYTIATALVICNLAAAIFHLRGSNSVVLNLGTAYRVAGIRVLDGDLYEVRYYEGTREFFSLMRTAERTRHGSRNKIINFLNSVERPRLVVIYREGEVIVGDFVFVLGGSDLKFSDWLKSNRLSYG